MRLLPGLWCRLRWGAYSVPKLHLGEGKDGDKKEEIRDRGGRRGDEREGLYSYKNCL